MDTQEYKGYTIEITQDEYPDDPRQWDNLGIMACWHRRYNLGDKQPRYNIGTWLSSLLYDFGLERYSNDGFVTEHYENFDHDLGNDCPEAIEKALAMLGKVLVVLPLYLYDHGGLSMSTSHKYPFNCPWDAGQVGFIYVTKDDIRKEYSKQRINKKTLALALKVLRSEVEVYNQYLQGDVWGYTITQGDDNLLDACGGFFGYDYCLSEAQSQIDFELNRKDK